MHLHTPDYWERRTLIAYALWPLSWCYRWGSRMRRAKQEPVKVKVPVVCVGNLTAGGAGKTPVALALGRLFREEGRKVHFLSKGYGGRLTGPVMVNAALQRAADVGDEPFLLAEVAPTWVARERATGAQVAISAGAEVLIMDDGFQNPTIQKDLSLVVVDGPFGFGNGFILPAGPLREPVREGLARADVLVVIGEPKEGLLETLPANLPVLRAVLEPTERSRRLEGKRVYAFAGIGRPEKFFTTLGELGCEVVGAASFPDHHPYTEREMTELEVQASRQKAILVTTEKDVIRIPEFYRRRVEAVGVEIHWKNLKQLHKLLAPFLHSHAA